MSDVFCHGGEGVGVRRDWMERGKELLEEEREIIFGGGRRALSRRHGSPIQTHLLPGTQSFTSVLVTLTPQDHGSDSSSK